MKTISLVIVLLGSGLLTLRAQSAASMVTDRSGRSEYQITVREANSQIWQRTEYETTPDGKQVAHVHQYTEVASGLNHQVNGQWMKSSETIDILPNGTAVATNGQHQAYFPGDIYDGAIELVTPDGQNLISRPMGLSYYDGTNSVLIAELTNSIGTVVGDNQVIYANAFTDFKVDLRYTYTKAGFEQDIILRQQPPTPESLGLNPDTTRLEVLTEFFDPPQPQLQSRKLAPQAGLTLTDQTLSFGSMQMAQGRAFLLGNDAQEAGALVNKQWLLMDERQFLVEEVPVDAIVEGLAKLPLTAINSGSGKALRTASKQRVLPPQRLAINNISKSMMLAKATPLTPGYVLDYQTINGSLTNYTFQGDTTYYISGGLTLKGTNTIEGGAVLKFTNSSYYGISLASSPGSPCIISKAGPYRMAVFTSMDDNSVGETIAGSTGNPTNTGAWYLYLNSPNSLSNNVLSYLRFSYAGIAIAQSWSSIYYVSIYPGPISHCQFINCTTAISDDPYYYSTMYQKLYNVLFVKCGTAVNNVRANYSGYVTVSGVNITADQANTMLTMSSNDHTTRLILTNSILTGVQYTIWLVDTGSGSLYATTTNACFIASTNAGIFQSVGGGNYYLATNSPYRNAGTTNIDSTLLTQLRQKTTYPPISYTNYTFTTTTTFSPQAQRDTDTPDLGYHYDPLDYCWDNLNLTNATLILTNGVAIGVSGTSGLILKSGATLISQGTPSKLNQLVGYQSVQEQPIFWGATNTGWTFLNPTFNNTAIQLRFTAVSTLAAAHDTIYLVSGSGLGSLTLRDCEVSGVLLYIFDPMVTSPGYVAITNNLFWRCHLDFGNIFNSYPLNFYNNLCFGGEVDFYGNSGWTVKDNLFDSVITAMFSGVVNDYNGYHNATGLFGSGGNDQMLTYNVTYQTGPLGNYYYPDDYSDLAWLIDAGSTTASARGLYHYTTQTNQVKDASSIVDIGYHYVAVDNYGNPLDSNGDGSPDYLEDANGNGIYDIGELGTWNAVIDGTIPSAWYTANGLDPGNPTIGIQDADMDGLLNQQEYLYGTDPNVSQGFMIWIGAPNGTTHIP